MRLAIEGAMRGNGGHSGRTSYKSEYRGLEEVKTLLTEAYGPSLNLNGASDRDFNFKTTTFDDSVLTLRHCYASDKLNLSFESDSDDFIIIVKPRGDFAIHTWCGDHPLAHDVGVVFTMSHAIGFSSAQSTLTTNLQIRRSGFDAILQQYTGETPPGWSGIENFSLAGGFGHLIQALSNRYRESFEAEGASDASLNLVRSATMVAISELVSNGGDGHRRDQLVASRRNVLRAVDMINSQTAPLTIHDLSSALGISVRALQDGFRKHLNASPHSLLKTGRIEGARRDLLSGRAGSVREAAAKWGFSNIARFNQDYFAVIGDYPKDALHIWRGGDDDCRLRQY